MFQICNEIVLELLKSPNSISAIAKVIGSNKTTVMRAVNELIKVNAVSYTMQGRNKMICLKTNLTARNRIYMAELYKLDKILAKYPRLKIILKETLQKTSKNKMVILFGSYAKMIAKKTSDIDLYVDTGDTNLKKELQKHGLSIKIGAFDKKSPLIKEIIRNHAVVKGVEAFYEKTGFFEET